MRNSLSASSKLWEKLKLLLNDKGVLEHHPCYNRDTEDVLVCVCSTSVRSPTLAGPNERGRRM